MLLKGTYGQGFARNAAESEYPELWRGLVGSWPTSLGVTGLTLRDWSPGPANNGTLTNMDTGDWVVSSRGVWVLDYDGSDDFASLGQPVSLQFGASDPFSLSVWVYWSSGALGVDNVFAYTNNAGYYVAFSDGVVVTDGIFFDYFPSPSFRRRQTGNNAIQRDTWHHIVVSQDGTNNNTGMKIWIDGERADVSGSGSGNPSINYSGRTAAIGNRTGVGVVGWNGQIDDVTIHNRALLPNEIQLMYEGASPHTPIQRGAFKAPDYLLMMYNNMSGNIRRQTGGML